MSDPLFSVEDQIVVVSGSSRGIGRAIAAGFASAGANVLIVSRNVDEAISLLSLDHDARAVDFSNHCDREMVVLADPQRLLQVFINLLSNARDASPDQGEITVWAQDNGNQVTIHVEDQGRGIAPEMQSRVFEPFYTSKEPGEGTGLGLALVFSIMEDMGGSVHITSPLHAGEAAGTRLTLSLATANYGAELEV